MRIKLATCVLLVVLQPRPEPILRINVQPGARLRDVSTTGSTGDSQRGHTAAQVLAGCGIQTDPGLQTQQEGEFCIVSADIESITMDLAQEIQVSVTPNAGATLRAHEEGHVEINRLLFQQRAEIWARQAMDRLPGQVVHRSLSNCGLRDRRADIRRAIRDLCGQLSLQVTRGIHARLLSANQDYDRATSHGQRGGEGGQRELAEQIVRRHLEKGSQASHPD